MTPSADPAPSRPFAFALWLALPLAAMGLLLAIDPAPLDFWISRHFYVPGSGFVARDNYWLETVLHDRAKTVVIVFVLALGVALAASARLTALRSWRGPLAYALLAITLSTAVVPPLKVVSAVQCPWDLSHFGGGETFSPLLAARPPTEHPGRCWPAGHASSGFSLIALFFALRDRRPRLARGLLAGALAFGSLLAAGRMMQGAHFLSHNLWTLLLDWSICLLVYRFTLYRPARLPTAQRRRRAIGIPAGTS
ncbi:phosphatase PAP2 family protein [Azonexus sp.]|uniref:phosphatase PAP2 family protein n=1 Tax=Azonexus sp. TaxID=1872668 RepID=UPI0035AE60FC